MVVLLLLTGFTSLKFASHTIAKIIENMPAKRLLFSVATQRPVIKMAHVPNKKNNILTV